MLTLSKYLTKEKRQFQITHEKLGTMISYKRIKMKTMNNSQPCRAHLSIAFEKVSDLVHKNNNYKYSNSNRNISVNHHVK